MLSPYLSFDVDHRGIITSGGWIQASVMNAKASLWRLEQSFGCQTLALTLNEVIVEGKNYRRQIWFYYVNVERE
jgi:hypothetical protein